MSGLLKEAWVPGIKENPVPDHSFVMASVDMSEYVDNNKLHLAEAGIEPSVEEDFFNGNENDLPLASIADIPSEVSLRTYSTHRTRHRNLQDAELQYNKKQSIVTRHRTALGKNIGARAAFSWTPSTTNDFNKIITVGTGKIIDAIIDLGAFYDELDITGVRNICFNPQHMALIRKEDYKLYKEIKSEKGADIYGFKIYSYSKNPVFTSAGAKKPYGAVVEAGDTRCTFTWITDEVFRCFGDTEMYSTLGAASTQADEISFAQRALVGKIRANNPKYLGAII